ncbi:hypothetical protein AXG55_09130 [Silvanigrella aquatica]|uniref:Amine oxidase domain-containing protein n=2 Tax=Silvanigrella aquatica TaxID=1915309 RepID=A0A1L4D1H8_9BACT|nr:hypothetical protein AXG55_09130 [Silvanigrella aquatica]
MFRYTNSESLSWDTGPTLISLPQEITKIFQLLQKEPPQLIPVTSGCRLVFSDGTDWTLPAGEKNLLQYFKEKDYQLFENFSQILKISSNIFDFAEKNIFHTDPPSTMSLGMKSLSSGLFFRHPKVTLTPYTKVVDSLISNKNLREFFYHFASYVGVNPDKAQGGILSIAHVELNSDIVFPAGGVYTIADKLYKAACEYNVKFYFNTEVVEAKAHPHEDSPRSWNICLKNNNETSFASYDIIVSNSDPFVAAEKWLSNTQLKNYFSSYLKTNSLRPSESQFVILFDWKDASSLVHHVKIFPKSWRQSFIDVCENFNLPEDPCVYLVWPHATDKSISPRILYISAMAPNNLSEISWNQDFCDKYSEKILDICRKKLNLSFKGTVFKTITPIELENRTRSFKGGIYSATSSEYQPMSFHFSGLTKVPNIYFVGAGVHPGAGVTMVMKSAHRISKHIIQKFTNWK